MPDQDTDFQAPSAPPIPENTEQLAQSAISELGLWRDKHILNSPFSRDTRAYNRIHDAMAAITAAMTNVKE